MTAALEGVSTRMDGHTCLKGSGKAKLDNGLQGRPFCIPAPGQRMCRSSITWPSWLLMRLPITNQRFACPVCMWFLQASASTAHFEQQHRFAEQKVMALEEQQAGMQRQLRDAEQQAELHQNNARQLAERLRIMEQSSMQSVSKVGTGQHNSSRARSPSMTTLFMVSACRLASVLCMFVRPRFRSRS